MRTVRIGLLGLGTVGSQVALRLLDHSDLLGSRSGSRLVLARALVRDLERPRAVALRPDQLTERAEDVVDADDVDVVVELLGGEEPALSLIQRALDRGRHVVTANKLVIARHGASLSQLAVSRNRGLLFEAAVGGGIPLLGPLTAQLSATRLRRVHGIVNSTTNFILDQVANHGLETSAAVAEAQRLGYAEADPSSDVDGYDAAYKISILASLAFDGHLDPAAVQRTGIGHLQRHEFESARAAGQAVKLVGCAEDTGAGISAWVRPCRVPAESVLGRAEGSSNVFCLEGDLVERVFISGTGAGGPATSSAVLADLVTLARSLASGAPARIAISPRPLAGPSSGFDPPPAPGAELPLFA